MIHDKVNTNGTKEIRNMENKKRKIVFITVIILIIAVIGSVGGYTVYKQNQIKERSATVKADIAGNLETFDKENDRNKKLEIFKKLSSDKSAYQKEEHSQKEVLKDFENTLEKMKAFFSKDYDKIISDNTLSDIEKISDKAKITTAKENLEKLLDTIKSENDTLKLENLEEKTTAVQSLIEKYTNRVKAIEEEEAKKKAEEEAKKKAEEEARKKAEEEAQAQNNSGSSSNDGNYNEDSSSPGNNNWSDGESNSSGSSSSNGGENSSSGRYILYTVEKNGWKTIYYSDGTVEHVSPDGNTDDITGNGDIYG